MDPVHHEPLKRGPRIWTCDHCGKRETWRKGWSYWPCVESPANSPDPEGLLLPLAGCSPACADAALDAAVERLFPQKTPNIQPKVD